MFAILLLGGVRAVGKVDKFSYLNCAHCCRSLYTVHEHGGCTHPPHMEGAHIHLTWRVHTSTSHGGCTHPPHMEGAHPPHMEGAHIHLTWRVHTPTSHGGCTHPPHMEGVHITSHGGCTRPPDMEGAHITSHGGYTHPPHMEGAHTHLTRRVHTHTSQFSAPVTSSIHSLHLFIVCCHIMSEYGISQTSWNKAALVLLLVDMFTKQLLN